MMQLIIFFAFLKKVTTTGSSHFLSPNGQGYYLMSLLELVFCVLGHFLQPRVRLHFSSAISLGPFEPQVCDKRNLAKFVDWDIFSASFGKQDPEQDL